MPGVQLLFSAGALLGQCGGLHSIWSPACQSFSEGNSFRSRKRTSPRSLKICRATTSGLFLAAGAWQSEIPPCQGDSHAGALAPAISNIADTPGLYAVLPACPPVPGYVNSKLRGDEIPRCKAHNQAILEKLRADKDINVVILVAFWSAYNFTGEDLRHVLDALDTKKVILIGDNPTPKFFVARTLALNLPLKEIRPSASPESFRIIRDYPNAKLIELSEALCRDNNCPPSQSSSALYADSNHLSVYAVKTIVTPFLKGKLSGIMPGSSEAAIVPRNARLN